MGKEEEEDPKEHTEGAIREIGGDPGEDRVMEAKGGQDFKEEDMVSYVTGS